MSFWQRMRRIVKAWPHAPREENWPRSICAAMVRIPVRDTRPLKDIVMEQVPWLIEELGFRIGGEENLPNLMGYSAVTLWSGRLGVKFERDRSFIRLYLAGRERPGDWHGMEHVIEVLEGFKILPPLPRGMLEQADILRQNLARFELAMGSDLARTEAGLKAHLTMSTLNERMRRWPSLDTANGGG